MPRARWLTSCPGRGRGWRRYRPAELLPLAERAARRLGAARPSDISGLDHTSTHCWQVVRPQALDVPGNITVLNGKGWTRADAALGACMEFLERHWAERSAVGYEIAPPSVLERAGRYFIPAAAVPLPLGIPDPGDAPLAWVTGTTFWGQDILLPAHDVLCPFVAPAGAQNPSAWRSAGLAAGGHPVEAVLHGLFEIIERDAVAVFELGGPACSVDLTTSGSVRIQALLPALESVGIRPEAKQLPAIGGVTVVLVTLDDEQARNPMRIVSGHAAHVDPFMALEQAILEALQARTVIIAGAREDLDEYGAIARLDYAEAKRAFARWIEPSAERVAAPAAPLPAPDDLAEVVLAIERRLRHEQFQPMVVVELSPAESMVSVVRVVVPRCSEVSHGNIRIGRRLAGQLRSTMPAGTSPLAREPHPISASTAEGRQTIR